MVITKIFVNTLHYVLRAKMRVFVRRSVFRYAIASAVIAYTVHFLSIRSIVIIEFAKIWVVYFIGISAVALVLILISAITQSRRLIPRQVTFKEEGIIVSQGGATEIRTWDWIISAEENSDFFAFLLQKRPRLEIFLSKDNLEDHESQFLRDWLIKHEKLSID